MDERPGHGPRPTSIQLTTGNPSAVLEDWIAAARVAEAARARARQRGLERQAEEESTLGGVLLDLAERSRPVVVSTAGGSRFRGPVRVLGADFVIVGEPGLGDVVVPLKHLVTVRPAPADDGGGGDRPFTAERVLSETLVELAEGHPSVLVAAGPDELRGELRSAGIDVLRLTLHGPGRDVVHVSVGAVDHLVILNR